MLPGWPPSAPSFARPSHPAKSRTHHPHGAAPMLQAPRPCSGPLSDPALWGGAKHAWPPRLLGAPARVLERHPAAPRRYRVPRNCAHQRRQLPGDPQVRASPYHAAPCTLPLCSRAFPLGRVQCVGHATPPAARPIPAQLPRQPYQQLLQRGNNRQQSNQLQWKQQQQQQQ